METIERRARRRYTAEEKQILLARFSSSGKSQAAFCRANGVLVPTFARWRSRRPSADGLDGKLVEVAVSARAPEVLVEVNGCTLRVAVGISPEWLAAVVRALRACSG